MIDELGEENKKQVEAMRVEDVVTWLVEDDI